VTVTPAAAATTWDVYPGDSIQAAIDGASDGDTVFVHAGTYDCGCLELNTPNVTLKGEGADAVILDGLGGGDNMRIGGSSGAYGCIVEGFNMTNANYGVTPFPIAPNCIFRNNVFYKQNQNIVIGAANTTFINNIVLEQGNDYYSVQVHAPSCTIVNNTIRDCTASGISLETGDCIDCIVANNNIISNGYCGIELYGAGSGNKIYLNNFVDTGITATTSGTTPPAVTYWNSTEPIEYTYGGAIHTNYLGNYWGSDYTGSDGDGDGIGDTPYTVPDSLGEDHRPLMEPFENYLGEEAADPNQTYNANAVYFVPEDFTVQGYCNSTTVEVWVNTSFATIGGEFEFSYTVSCANVTDFEGNPDLDDTNWFNSLEWSSAGVDFDVEEAVGPGSLWVGNLTIRCCNESNDCVTDLAWIPEQCVLYNAEDDGIEIENFGDGTFTCEPAEEPSTPTPPTSFLISGNITYDNGNPVMNPVVTVTNLATSEDFIVKTDADSNYYLTLTDSTHVTAGDTIRINASDGTVSNETDHPVTASEITTGGFVQDMTIESGELPDLTITEKSEEWISLADATYNVTCTVANIGTFDADASTTAIEIDGDWVTNDSVPALAIGENHTSILGPFTLSGENDTIRICADSGEIINELNETNNCLENVLEAPGMPDLIVWVALKTPGYVNEDNILGVRVKNTGSEDAGSFNVSLAIDETQVPEQTVSSLAAGETTEIEYAWMPAELGGHALSATVDTNNDVSESDETNNDFARTSVIIKPTDWAQFHYDEVHSGFSPSGAPNTNQTLWISDELSAIGGTSTVVADGKVFAYGGPTSPYGSGEGVLYCIDEFTGAIIWNISIPTPAYGSWSSPAYHNGRVFTSTNTEAGCYNATTGEQIWVFENPTGEASCNGGPVVADGKVIVNDWQAGHFYCLDEETGELLWNFTETKTGNWGVGYAQGVPAYEDGKFYLTTWLYIGGNVYCVDADTGAEIWNQTTPLDTCGSPAVVDGTVYVTNYKFDGDGAIYAMNASDGEILWHQTIQRSDSTPAVAYGNVYVTGGCLGYSDRQTYCFNATTGDLVWETDTADTIGGWTCSVAVADGKVFVGTEGGASFDYAGTYALDAFTGDVIWSYPQGGSSSAVADDIVFTIGGGRVYAFYTSKPDLTVAAIETPANLRNDVINPITATIENIGGTDAENFDVSLDVDGTQVDTTTIATLAAGENTTVELLWTPTATGGATLTVIADAGNSVEELDETNNELTKDVEVILPAGVTFDRKKLDMNSNGILKAFITLPEGYDVADINVSTVECEGAHAFGDGSVIPGKQALEVKFKIPDLVDVPTGDAVSLSVTGELTTGERFEGSNTVKVTAK